MNPELRQRRLLIIALSAIGVLMADRFILTPAIAYWQEANQEIATLRRQITAGAGTLAISDRTRVRWEELQAATIPREVAQSEQILLSHLNLWGDQVGTDVGSIKPQWKRGDARSYSTLECRVDTTGSLTAISRFIHAIESSPLALRIDSLEMISRDERGQKITATLVVSGLRLQPLESRR